MADSDPVAPGEGSAAAMPPRPPPASTIRSHSDISRHKGTIGSRESQIDFVGETRVEMSRITRIDRIVDKRTFRPYWFSSLWTLRGRLIKR